jgi:hypothetical protein
MSVLTELQKWYLAQCDGDWEHSYGVTVGTLDNPGWTLTVDLTDTTLDGRSFAGHSYGVGPDGEASGDEWLHCAVEKGRFTAAGGPEKLEEMIGVFLQWANSTA